VEVFIKGREVPDDDRHNRLYLKSRRHLLDKDPAISFPAKHKDPADNKLPRRRTRTH